MKVVIAIDSFKGSLTSLQAGNAAEEGIKKVYPDAEIFVRPVADGGEGTVDTLVSGLQGEKHTVNVTGPLGEPVLAEYGIIDNHTAVIEMSAAAGITLVSPEKRNPLYTTTYGVGEIIIDAIKKNCRNFIIGIGGSATNDGGIGMLQALGYGMLDQKGEQVPFGARGLEALHSITCDKALPELKNCTFNIACDVTNPLCGENGCSAVYGPQKGADKGMIEKMDGWLSDYSELARGVNANEDKDFPGAGAAGGMGYAFMTFLNATLKRGIDLILDETELEKYIKDADFVITGEGRLDSQTVMGKVPVGVAKIAKKYDKPVLAFSGCVTDEAGICNLHGIDSFFPIIREVCSLEDAMDSKTAFENMTKTVEQAFRLINICNIV